MNLLSLVERKKENKVKQYIVDNKDALYRFAYTYVRNEQDALDITHDSICKSLANINTLRDIDNIKPWIYKIITNTAIDYIRKNKKYVKGIDELNLEEAIEYDSYEDIDLQKALDKLPEKYRAVIILRYFEDMKISDIAEVLGENVSTIKSRLYNALSKLKISITE